MVMDCAQGRDAQASRPTAGEARATGVVGFLSCREATFRRELPERGEEAEAPGQLKSLGTDAFTASLTWVLAPPEREAAGAWESDEIAVKV